MKIEKKENKTIEEKDKDIIISFLKATHDGKYAKIEKTSLPYSRIKEETVIVEDEYYYSIR